MKQAIPFETRVITALANHERLLQQVGQMKNQIGAHLAECPVMKKANDWNISAQDSKDLYDEKMLVKTHLWEAFNETVEGDYGSPQLLDRDEQQDFLADEDTGCEHCYAAWRVIQERRDVRQELGRARRSLRMLGKSALKALPS
jgi:hypothetical protein